jgi:putative ABC transport system permease protein
MREIFQFIVVTMILAASGIAGLVVTLLMRTRVFTAAAQLTLRPGKPHNPALILVT